MNKINLTLALGRAIASSLLGVAPSIQAGENPFAISSIDPFQQLAAANDNTVEAGYSAKIEEGNCGSTDNKC